MIGGYFVFVGVSLAGVWLGMWAAYVFAGRPTPIAPEAFKLVAALDTVLMVPALAVGGVLLWRRNAWGYVIAAIAGVQELAVFACAVDQLALCSSRETSRIGPEKFRSGRSLAAATSAATALLFAHAERRLEV